MLSGRLFSSYLIFGKQLAQHQAWLLDLPFILAPLPCANCQGPDKAGSPWNADAHFSPTHLLLFYFGGYDAHTVPATLRSEVYKHTD